jgi:putative membrane protein
VIPLDLFPTINASLNATSAVLLAAGFRFIKRGDIARHKRCMVAACVTSALFLVSYVTYHVQAGSTRFPGTGVARAAYLVLLASHVVLAAAIVPLAITTLTFALRGSFARHRRVARVTFPIWMYVSVTGVLVYLILYHLV